MRARLLGFAIMLAALPLRAVPALSQQVWLAPRVPAMQAPGIGDFNALFQPTGAWSLLASQINVFMVTAGYVLSASDGSLQTMAANLAEHHVGLAISLQSIAQVAGDSCGHQEGYGAPSDSAAAASKLSRLGIALTYARLDEPLWFGHYDRDPQACRLSVPELAQRVALNLGQYVKRFPDLIIGDVEPAPILQEQVNWRSSYREFLNDLKSAVGVPVTFVQSDVDWRIPSWQESLQATSEYAHAMGLKFGVIYNGDGFDTSSAKWVSAARAHYRHLESLGNVIPDQAVFQSWNKYPTRVLPETADTTLGYLVGRYVLPRAKVIAHRTADGISGQLIGPEGLPVPGAKVDLEAVGYDPARPLPLRVVSGVVPAHARYAILGMRVNQECLCAGPNDIVVGALNYTESEGGNIRYTYDLPAAARRRQGHPWNGVLVATVNPGGELAAHIIVTPDQKFGFNSPMFPVTPGARFEFRVPTASATGAGMFGAVTIIWLNGDRRGFRRTDIAPEPEVLALTTAVTGRQGGFIFPPLALHEATIRVVRLAFSGTDTMRGTITALH